MNFTKFDMELIIIMSLAIILMSFVFPAVGLTDMDSATENEIPEFNITSDRFDFAGEFPDNPGSPSQGDLIREHNNPGPRTNINLDGDTQNGTEMTLFNNGNTTDPVARVAIVNWDAGVDTTDEVILNEGDRVEFENFSYTIFFEFTDVEDRGTNDMTMTVTYEIVEQPSDESWLGRIPVVGGIMGAGEQLAGIVGWIGSVIWWGVTWFFEIAVNLLAMLADGMLYLVDLLHWLTSTYGSIINGANGFASVFAMIPGTVLFVEFVKLVFIAISLLPTT